jgi:peptidoglycan/LPS O-acetylase OafA/YrhL
MKYRADIDGMRGVAVLFVLLCHFSFGLRGGYTGVDVFFVISGWLITSIVFRELEAGNFSPVKFMERRVRRLAPALLTMLAAVLVAGWFLIWPAQYREVGSSAVSVLTFSSNIFFWRKTGYFADSAQSQPLLHTWSLAVEEQYYLLFPFLCLMAFRWSGTRGIYKLIAIATLASLGASCYGTIYHRSAAFYLLPSRLWEMGAGGLAVLAQDRARQLITQYASWFSIVGAALLVFPALCYTEGTVFPGFAAIPSVVGTVLLLFAGVTECQPVVNRALAAAPLRFLGKISYSLYLWHWPILVILGSPSARTPSVAMRLGLFSTSVLIAILSWRWIEQPFRDLRLLPKRSQLFAVFGFACVLTIATGTAIVLTSGAEFRISPQLKAFQETTRRAPEWCHEHTAKDVPNGLLRLGKKNLPPGILVWGDSHAMSILPAIDLLCQDAEMGAVAATHSSTAPLIGYFVPEQYGLNEKSIEFSDAVLNYVSEERIEKVLLVSTWWYLDQIPESRQALLSTVKKLLSAGAQVYVLRTVPVFDNNVAEQLIQRSFMKLSIEHVGMTEQQYQQQTAFTGDLESELKNSGVIVLNPADQFPRSPSGLIAPYDSNGAFYYDAQHLSPYGAKSIGKVFNPLIAKMPDAVSEDPE